ncbi:TetR family transcriptional regulator [Bartonella sp. M0280]|uniref:TetR family transcriptional regulator n=1 Tax=Bartonella apihabitans TaxID=2750929 RepID=UPI0018DC7435|nr:TetR family transcriptional regulator [Bartonella apihabitans]MBI0166545.1 TetR family transcriptional regulator [Bartonella apihabitans]
MRRTKAAASETREAILDAAETAFLTKGVSKTSLNEIAERAGVTRGAIYFHFRDKPAIYNAIIDRIKFPQEDLIDEVSRNDSINPIDVLEKSACASLNRFAEDEHQQRVMTIITLRCEYVDEFSQMILRLREAHDSMLDLFTRMLYVARSRDMLSDEWEPEDGARVLVCVVGGILHEWLNSAKNFDLYALGTRLILSQTRSFRKNSRQLMG